MENRITQHRKGFQHGITEVTSLNDSTGIRFTIIKLMKGEQHQLNSPYELACLHLNGNCTFSVDQNTYQNNRTSIFDEAPFAIHLPPNHQSTLVANSDVECALFETKNSETFPPIVYTSEMTGNEHRGKGFVDDTSLRFVRTIFDGSNSHPNTQLVLGEVVNFPGRWSSYPPHHHPQPEIYHYRFTDDRGYGHAELGEEVLKVRQYDTVKILDELDHAQCSAPGYGMYYIWVIRHLPQVRYTVPEFTEEHRWTMDSDAQFWKPKVESPVC